ncbi:MAG: hypothetical protein H5U07_07125 [Candidatus Aminicenantes bacterium]|nr:hypothetical protein [Candidatus Aminicenantes bacterium]
MTLACVSEKSGWGPTSRVTSECQSRSSSADQFGDEKFVKEALLKKGKNINLVQRTKAEDDLAVAAASILARAEFLYRLKKLSEEVGLELPKGASPLVEEAAVKLVRQFGPEVLSRVAKLHFKTTEKVLKAAGL